jgi:Glycosyltransferase family 9 (heptosyltransferase)
MPRTHIAPISFGLGDLVVSLPAIHAAISENPPGETWLVARSDRQAALADRIAGLGGCVHEGAFHPAGADGSFLDLRDHPLQRDYWWGTSEFEEAFGPLSINEILARICADFGIPADLARPEPLVAQRKRPDVGDAVLFVADSDSTTKRWGPDRWAEVARDVRARGYDVRLVTRDARVGDMSAIGVDPVCAPTPGDAVDVLSSCRAVVGVDTGLTHIAAQQGTPTVALHRDRPVYFRPWPHCRAVVGDRCDESCRAVEQAYAYNSQVGAPATGWQPRTCPVSARCLEKIRPADVSRALCELV